MVSVGVRRFSIGGLAEDKFPCLTLLRWSLLLVRILGLLGSSCVGDSSLCLFYKGNVECPFGYIRVVASSYFLTNFNSHNPCRGRAFITR